MRGNNQCPGCHHWVDAHGRIEGGVAGWCGFSPTPRPITPDRLGVTAPCALSGIQPGPGPGVVVAQEWDRVAGHQADLDVRQFRGVALAQVCHECAGSGLAPGSRWHIERGSPRYKHPCEECGGRGFHGERKEGIDGTACTTQHDQR